MRVGGVYSTAEKQAIVFRDGLRLAGGHAKKPARPLFVALRISETGPIQERVNR